MAKIKGPLFSLAASGTVGRISFSQAGTATHARNVPRQRADSPTQYQIDHRQRCKDAAASWAAMSVFDKDKWHAKGTTTRPSGAAGTVYTLNNGWPLYFQEWLLQNIDPPGAPRLPA